MINGITPTQPTKMVGVEKVVLCIHHRNIISQVASWVENKISISKDVVNTMSWSYSSCQIGMNEQIILQSKEGEHGDNGCGCHAR